MKFCWLFLLTPLVACGPVPSEQNDGQAEAANVATIQQAEPLKVDIASLIGAKKVDIDALWGEPDCPPKNACVYGEMQEVFFVDGRADSVTLPPTDDLRFYGLDLGKPSFENPDAGLRVWDTEINGRGAEVRQFANYVYIKAAKP
jgi:hypothetical protein